MIIRGNTVSTTIAPKKIAEEIGGTGGTGVGVAPLIVTMNAETGKATHDSEQIAQHLRDGRTVIARNIQTAGDYLRIQDFYYSKCYTSEQHDGSVMFYVSFVNTDGPILTELQIDDTGEITVNVIDQIGDISSALDELHAYAQELGGVVVQPDEPPTPEIEVQPPQP